MLKDIIHPFKKWWQFILANIGLGFLIVVFFNDLDSPIKIVLGALWASAISITQWLGHTYFQIKIGENFSWLDEPLKRFFITLLVIIGYSIFAYGVVQLIMNLLISGTVPSAFTLFDFDYWSFPAIISLFIALIFSVIGFFKAWKKEVVEKERLKNKMLTYKYEALRNQINPHFMFNSLNVLTDLVYEDQKTAVKFIHQFSDIYRYVLDSREKELVPLTEELEFLNKYIFLLKTRFDSKLDIQINLDPNSNDLVVPLALQLLIENAVKHNKVSSKNNLVVTIKKENDFIVVSNPIKLKNIGDTSKQIGLRNLKEQYSFFTGNAIQIIDNNGTFTVKLPLIHEA